MDYYESSSRVEADHTHPVDLIEPMASEENADRIRAFDFIERSLLWISDSQTLRDRGLRCTAAVWAIRPDVFNGSTLEQLAVDADCDPQAIHRLAKDFRQTLGIHHE